MFSRFSLHLNRNVQVSSRDTATRFKVHKISFSYHFPYFFNMKYLCNFSAGEIQEHFSNCRTQQQKSDSNHTKCSQSSSKNRTRHIRWEIRIRDPEAYSNFYFLVFSSGCWRAMWTCKKILGDSKYLKTNQYS